MPRYAPSKMPTAVKTRYFELLREGCKGAAAARVVGVSASCGSNWFIEAGSMIVPDPGPTAPRFLTQNDRIAIADGLQAKQSVKEIAASIGKSFQTVYREINRNAKPDGGYHPWWAHNQSLLRRHRPKQEKFRAFDAEIRTIICTTNAIESANARLRRAVRARGHFPSDAAALKCLYLALIALDPTGTAKARWTRRWKPALNAFEIAFEGRLIRTTH